jgi:uncharacterized MAPEG superfamily protein
MTPGDGAPNAKFKLYYFTIVHFLFQSVTAPRTSKSRRAAMLQAAASPDKERDRMDTSFELTMLAGATVWGFVQLVAAAQAANVQYGLRWAASPRDAGMPPLKPIPGRISRNFQNYMETFPFFVAAVLVAEAAGVHNALTWWGSIAYLAGRVAYTALYISGVPLIRSLFWNVAAFGMLAVLAAPFLPG